MRESARKPNELLRHAREIRGWSQRKVAEEIGVTEDKVSRWERGERKPSPYYREKLCVLFELNAEELGFIQKVENISKENKTVPKTSSATELVKNNPLCNNKLKDANSTFSSDYSLVLKDVESDPAMDKVKRDSIKKISAAVGAAFLIPTQNLAQSSSPLWERLARTLEKSSKIDEVSLSGLGEVTKNYWQLRTNIGYRNLLNAFIGHLETIQQLLQTPQTEANYKRLCVIASEASQRIGAIYFDMNDYANARAYYQVSLKAASEAKNSILYAVGLGRMSSLPIYADNPKDSLPLLKEAQRVAQKQDLKVILAWLASIEAEALANLHLHHECLNALGRAEITMQSIKSDDNTSEIKFDYARLVGYKGTCLLRLHQPKAALKALSEISLLPGSLSPRQESIITADIAEAYLQQGEIEIACNYAIKAVEMADITKSNLVIQRLQKIKENMSQWEHLESVNDFHERIVLRTLLL